MYVFASVGDNTGATEIVGPSNALYVDVAGDDATGTRGNAALPFLTIGAALDAMASDVDEIMVSPGTFAPAAALKIPVGLKQMHIRGSGTQLTFIVPVVDIDAFDFGTAGATKSSISDLTITPTGTGSCMVVDGTGLGTGLFASGLLVERVSMTVGAAGTMAIDFYLFGPSTFIDCTIVTGSMQFATTGNVLFRGFAQTGTSAGFYWDESEPVLPTGGQSLVQIREGSTLVAAGLIGQQARIYVDSSSSMTSLSGDSLSVAAGPISPSIEFHGTVGTIDFRGGNQVLPDSALGVYTVDFSDCTITGATAQFETVTSGLPVNMTGFKSTAAVFALTAGVKIDIAALGASIRCRTFATVYATPDASGSITPPYLTGIVDISAGGAMVRTWSQLGYTGLVRVGVTDYNAVVTSSAAACDAFITPAAKATTGLGITAAAVPGNTTANVLITF